MEDNSNNNNNYLNQSLNQEKNKSQNIQSFISNNISNSNSNSISNSGNLEDIIFKELKENKKSYLNNGIYFKRKIEGSNPNTKRGKNNSLFNSESNSEKNNNISRSEQFSNVNNHSLYKSFKLSNNIQYSPNKNYIPDSDEEEKKEEKEENNNNNDENKDDEDSNNNNEDSESESIRLSNKILNNNYDQRIEISSKSIKDINNSNDIHNSNNNIEKFYSHKELLSSLKSGNISQEQKFSIKSNFSKLNIILQSRNTISYIEKPHYQVLAYTLSNKSNRNTFKSQKNSINSKASVDYEKQAKIIQKWWRSCKAILDGDLNKIIKIQSIWRGKISRKYTADIICLCFCCNNFYDILSSVIKKNVRKLVWNYLFCYNNEIMTKMNILINKYQYLKYYFEKWKCITKLLLYKADINTNSLELLEDKIIYKNHKKKNSSIPNDNMRIKFLFFKLVYSKLRLNKTRNSFYILKQYSFSLSTPLKSNKKTSYDYASNSSIKRYYLYKWINVIRNSEINYLRERFLKYLINKIYKKDSNNILFKYFSRWKLLADDIKIKFNEKKKLKRIKKYKKEKFYNNNNILLKLLINLTINIKRENNIAFILKLIRKWRFFIYSKKFANLKLLKMKEFVQKTYDQMAEDALDFDKKREEKYQIMFNDNIEDEEKFKEHICTIYNGNINKNFKFNIDKNKTEY